MINKAVFMTGLNKLEIRDIPMPQVKGNEVLVKIEYVGICGSDVHYLEHGKIGNFVVEGDFILGHECAGVVAAAGPDVKTLKVGDKVALEPGQTCGQCEFCKGGKYNLCPDVEFLATPPYQGCLLNYIAYPEIMAFKLPDNMSTKDGALVEPFAVGIHAANQGGVTLGSSAVVLGAGCIGLMTLAACKAFGAGDVTVVDVMENRLECAKKLGATRVINAQTQDVEKELLAATDGKGVDIVFETAGTTKTISQTANLVKTGGTIVLVGMAPEDIIPYNIAKILAKEAQIKTVFRYRNIYLQAIDAISGGTARVSDIVTHEFSFDEAAQAFDFVTKNKCDVVKAVIHVG
ncbi:MAG: NAD(P)-dependent alcohol dehydrogenase [Oscillospiraceae bacterium]|nr:NAD(P)-dependent alcohol dehydrogenase [Oscillospiraceae bacterium]